MNPCNNQESRSILLSPLRVRENKLKNNGLPKAKPAIRRAEAQLDGRIPDFKSSAKYVLT